VNSQEANNLAIDSQKATYSDQLVNDSQNAVDADQMVNDSPNASDADMQVNDSQNASDPYRPDSTKEEKFDDVKEFASLTAKASDSCEDIFFNPNVFIEFKLAGTRAEIAADEDNVRKVSQYLVDLVLPKFIQDHIVLAYTQSHKIDL